MSHDIVFKYGYEIGLSSKIHALNSAWMRHIEEIHSEPKPCIDIDGEAFD